MGSLFLPLFIMVSFQLIHPCHSFIATPPPPPPPLPPTVQYTPDDQMLRTSNHDHDHDQHLTLDSFHSTSYRLLTGSIPELSQFDLNNEPSSKQKRNKTEYRTVGPYGIHQILSRSYRVSGVNEPPSRTKRPFEPVPTLSVLSRTRPTGLSEEINQRARRNVERLEDFSIDLHLGSPTGPPPVYRSSTFPINSPQSTFCPLQCVPTIEQGQEFNTQHSPLTTTHLNRSNFAPINTLQPTPSLMWSPPGSHHGRRLSTQSIIEAREDNKIMRDRMKACYRELVGIARDWNGFRDRVHRNDSW